MNASLHSLKQLFRPSRRKAIRTRRPHRTRLTLEQLEDRSLPSVVVSGTVWHDTDGDGQREAGEPGLQGAVVELFRTTSVASVTVSDVSLGQAITDVDGSYQITAPDPLIDATQVITYHAQVRIPPGYAFTADHVGPAATDSDVSATGAADPFTVLPGGKYELDAGVTG